MNPHILLISPHGLGDQALMFPLLARLKHECPNAIVDLLAPQHVKEALPFMPVHNTYTYDLHSLDMEHAYLKHITFPNAPWVHTSYDCVLSFMPCSVGGTFADYVTAPVKVGIGRRANGQWSTTHGTWMQYGGVTGAFRELNLFHYGDIYALAGGGIPGPFHESHVTPSQYAVEWAQTELNALSTGVKWIAVHVGASHTHKRWRPAYFGETMALLSRQSAVGFLLTGTEGERGAAYQALEVYAQSGGVGPLYDAVGRTDLAHSLGLLSQCAVMLANDTGLMHWGALVGCKIVNLSVGCVLAQESAAYGVGHWAIQGDSACFPCSMFDPCSHQSCKDMVLPQAVTSLALHILDGAPLPTQWPGMKVHQSCVDADGLLRYEQRGGTLDTRTEWWALYWRKYWYERFTGLPSLDPGPTGPMPFAREEHQKGRHLEALLRDLEGLYKGWLATTDEHEKAALVKEGHRIVNKARDLSLTSPALRPLLAWVQWHWMQVSHLSGREQVERELPMMREWLEEVRRVTMGCTEESKGKRIMCVFGSDNGDAEEQTEL